MSGEAERFCPTDGCGKKLRSNNRKGVCGLCSNGVKYHLNGGAPKAPRKLRVATVDEAPPATGADLEKFKTVAEALGFDVDELLNEFAAEWLKSLREKLEADE